jgi:two-component system, LytTR family, response regulator
MNQIHSLIIDDEPAAVNVIKELCRHLTDDIIVDAVATNGIEAMPLILKYKPRLIFLDVNMPFMNGFQIIEKLAERDFEIVFTTGTENYAFRALKAQAADYLLKPIDPSDFIVAMEKVRSRLSQLPAPPGKDRQLQISTSRQILFIREDEIAHIRARGSYCEIHTVHNKMILVTKKLGHLQEKLSPTDFFRCHNSHVININNIEKLDTRDGTTVVLKNGASVNVSRRNKEELLRFIDQRGR